MRKFSKLNQKRLAKFVAIALMCTGGGLVSISAAGEAAAVTVTDVTGSQGSYTVTADGTLASPSGWPDEFYPSNADTLNITGTFSATGLTFTGAYGTGANNATVNINGTDITVSHILGADNETTSATGNRVNVSGGKVTVYNINGATGETAATGNQVNVSEGSTVYLHPEGYFSGVIGGYSSHGNAEGNTVTISGTLSPKDTSDYWVEIYGGVALGSGTAKDNQVAITGNAKIDTAASEAAQIYGAYSHNGSATDNTVTINGSSNLGEGKTYIYGGAGKTEASDNTVTIAENATLSSNTYIYGGLTWNGTGTANNNTVNILTSISVKHIMGGEGSTATGNTLNIASTDVTVGEDGVAGFQNINFYLPSDIASGDTMLTINSGATDLTGVTIGAAAQTGVSLAKGDTVNLISNSAGFTGTAATTTLTTPPTATSLTLDTSYKFAINQGDTAITATVTDKTESSTESSMERAKSLVETRAATTTFINAGADMLSSQGFAQAANAVALETAEQTAGEAAGAPAVSTFTPFAAVGGSSMRAQSGSYVDTKGFGLNVGFAREIANSQGKLLFGPVVEYGGGKYDSYLEDAAGTHGDGKAHYFGVGIMARQINHDGLYYEGSLRGGRVNSDYNSTMDTLGKVNYDSSSNYFAAHLGVGKAFNLGNGNTLDGYLKYFYSHQAGDTTTIHIENAADERGSFDAVDSHRLRLGARLTHKVNDRNSFYGGLAYQYEFGGEARAHFTSGGNVPSPSVRGGSGMLELGWQVKPGGPVTVDLGLTGWAGKQRGGSVQLGATWKF